MNINFSDKELQVIALMVPEMIPEDTINKVLRDWFNANLNRLPQQVKTADQVVDDVLAANAQNVRAATETGAIIS